MEKWELIKKGTDSVETYSKKEFNGLEGRCKHLIRLRTDNLYEIKYYPVKGKVETCDINVYF
jgi:hypothetical protein